jgi:hypothetical protein
MKSVDFITPAFFMFGISALNPGPPFFKIIRVHFPTHNRNDFRFLYAKLSEYSVKGGSVFPGHFNDSVNHLVIQWLHALDCFLLK